MFWPNQLLSNRFGGFFLASTFNDEQLRAQALKLRDPYDQGNLIWAVPDGAKLLDIINIYVYERYPLEKAFCVECGGSRHKRGFTAMLVTGERLLFGSTCGARRFEESWADAERRIEDRADRQFELKKLDRLSSSVKAMEAGLIGWQSAMEQISNRRLGFDRQLGELASRVREAVQRKNGALTVFRKLQNTAARVSKANALGGYQEVVVGQIRGIEFLHRLDPAKAIVHAQFKLDAIKASIGATDGISTKQLRSQRRAFDTALEDVETSARIHAGAEEFFTTENFSEMLEWANEHGATQARYVLTESNIVRAEGSVAGMQIAAPSPIDITLLDLIKDYRRAD
jgi:hypothetical protein